MKDLFIVGLGNPNSQTRHNVGQMFLDFLSKKWGLSWEKRKDLLIYLAKKDKVILGKPLVFMNESGRAVKKAVDKLKIDNQNLYVVHDELDLRLGSWKLTFGKSSPLHKGVLSVERYLKTPDFWRLRLGIDNRQPENRIAGEKYVLQKFTKKEHEEINHLFSVLCRSFNSSFLFAKKD